MEPISVIIELEIRDRTTVFLHIRRIRRLEGNCIRIKFLLIFIN
jgi:hypothetical protein